MFTNYFSDFSLWKKKQHLNDCADVYCRNNYLLLFAAGQMDPRNFAKHTFSDNNNYYGTELILRKTAKYGSYKQSRILLNVTAQERHLHLLVQTCQVSRLCYNLHTPSCLLSLRLFKIVPVFCVPHLYPNTIYKCINEYIIQLCAMYQLVCPQIILISESVI